MRFPKRLLRKNRTKYSSNKINSWHLMFTRHKPLTEWAEGDEYPNFSSIKITKPQSFNWSAFSLPIWVRYTDQKEYKSDYGVVGYRVGTLRYTNKIDPAFENFTFDVRHDPLENNFSHCELEVKKSLSKKDRRLIRITFKHKCVVSIYPMSSPSKSQLLVDYVRLMYHQISVRWSL